MARNITTKSGNKPKELGCVWEMEPGDVIVTDGKNVRYNPVPYQKLIEMAESIVTIGQLQPICVRVLKDKSYECVAGYTRLKAISLAREGFTNAEGETICVPELQVKVLLVDGKEISEETAIINALHENIQRQNLTPLDEAKAAERLSKEFGFKNVQIAKVLGRDPGQISRYFNLLELPEFVQDKVGTGEWSLFYAMQWRDDATKGSPEIAMQIDARVEEIAGTNGVSVPLRNQARTELAAAERARLKAEAAQEQADAEGKLNAGDRKADAEARAAEAQVKRNTHVEYVPEEDIEAHGTVEDAEDGGLLQDGVSHESDYYIEPAPEPEVETPSIIHTYAQRSLAEVKALMQRWVETEECLTPFGTVMLDFIAGKLDENEVTESACETYCITEPQDE